MTIFSKIPVFVINMEQDIEKKEHMIKLCHKKNISPTFIDATIGKELQSRNTNNIHSFKHVNQHLSHGEIGCALSHIDIYKKIVNDKIPFSLILEDDINIFGDIKGLLEQLMTLPHSWHIIHLGHHSMSSRSRLTKGSKWNAHKLLNQYKLQLPCEISGGTYGYLISYEGANQLLSELSSLDKPIDHYTGSDKHCNLLLLSPPVIEIHNYLSSNFTSMQGRSLSSYTESSSSLIKLIKKLTLLIGIYQPLDTLALKVKLTIKSFRPMKNYK